MVVRCAMEPYHHASVPRKMLNENLIEWCSRWHCLTKGQQEHVGKEESQLETILEGEREGLHTHVHADECRSVRSSVTSVGRITRRSVSVFVAHQHCLNRPLLSRFPLSITTARLTTFRTAYGTASPSSPSLLRRQFRSF